MKNPILFFSLIVLIFWSCSDTKNQNSFPDESFEEFLSDSTPKEQSIELSNHEFKDDKTGITVFTKRFPANWKVESKPKYDLDRDFPQFLLNIAGPNNLRVVNSGIKQFIDFSNQQYAQRMQSYGMQNIRPFISAKNILQNQVLPLMQKQGYSHKKSYPQNDIIAFVKQKMLENGTQNGQVDVVMTEWFKGDGQVALTIINQIKVPGNLNSYQDYTVWNYSVEYLFTTESDLAQNTEHMVNAAISYTESQNWLAYKSRKQQQRRQLQTAMHQQRMNQNRNQFNAHQRMMQERYQDSYANHEQFIDYIRDEKNVMGTNGQTYKVQSGADAYWFNDNGEYIMSNDRFYDPNLDMNINTENWRNYEDDY